MKIKDARFLGFTEKEQKEVCRLSNVDGEEEMFLNYGQMVADLIGADVGTMIQPGGKVSLIKLGR